MTDLVERLRPALAPLTYATLVIPLVFVSVFLAGIREGAGPTTIGLLALLGVLLLVALSLIHLYAAHAWASSELGKRAKVAWTVGMLVLGPPVLVAYWRLRLRPSRRPARQDRVLASRRIL